MKNIISEKLAINGILIILTLVVLFHLSVLIGIFPPEIVWGGRISDRSELVKMEIISILINLVMLQIVMVRAGYFKLKINPMIIKIALWAMTLLFLLNTIGNLFSTNSFEKITFTPLTFLLAVFCIRLAASNASNVSLTKHEGEV